METHVVVRVSHVTLVSIEGVIYMIPRNKMNHMWLAGHYALGTFHFECGALKRQKYKGWEPLLTPVPG